MPELEHTTSTDARPPKGETSVEELTRAQTQHARRVAESRATVPDLSATITVDMEAAAELLASLTPSEGGAPSLGFEDLVVKAAALALREAPRANGAYRDGRFERYTRVNVGIVTTTADGAATPVLFDADTRSVLELAAARVRLAGRARDGSLTHPEQNGGTFTLTSLAEFGVRHVASLLHQPQAAALAMGAVESRPVVREGAVVARRVVELTLSCDHRILHAADAGRLLRRLRELLEQPTLLTR